MPTFRRPSLRGKNARETATPFADRHDLLFDGFSGDAPRSKNEGDHLFQRRNGVSDQGRKFGVEM